MSYIEINKLFDLEYVLYAPIKIFGNIEHLYEEIYNNEWKIASSEEMIKKLKIEELQQFLNKLLTIRRRQLAKINPKNPVKFYLWFDAQALHLRFNLISGENKSLPFGAKLNIVNTPDNILEKFLTETLQYKTEGEVIEWLYPGDKGFDDEDDFSDFVLDVYCLEITPRKNLSRLISRIKR